MVSLNTLEDNRLCGVLLESCATGLFRGNTIRSNGPFGVLGEVDVATCEHSAVRKVLESEVESTQSSNSASPAAGARTVQATIGGGTATFVANEMSLHTVSNVHFTNHPLDNKITR